MAAPPPLAVESSPTQPVAREPSGQPSPILALSPVSPSTGRAPATPGTKRARDGDDESSATSVPQRKAPWVSGTRLASRKNLKKHMVVSPAATTATVLSIGNGTSGEVVTKPGSSLPPAPRAAAEKSML